MTSENGCNYGRPNALLNSTVSASRRAALHMRHWTHIPSWLYLQSDIRAEKGTVNRFVSHRLNWHKHCSPQMFLSQAHSQRPPSCQTQIIQCVPLTAFWIRLTLGFSENMRGLISELHQSDSWLHIARAPIWSTYYSDKGPEWQCLVLWVMTSYSNLCSYIEDLHTVEWTRRIRARLLYHSPVTGWRVYPIWCISPFWQGVNQARSIQTPNG